MFRSSGGVVAASPDGKIVCENTLDARLDVVFRQKLPEVCYWISTSHGEISGDTPSEAEFPFSVNADPKASSREYADMIEQIPEKISQGLHAAFWIPFVNL